jgi:hypothetical protein
VKVLDCPVKSSSFRHFPEEHRRPKRPTKTPIIPKNRTGSGRSKGTPETNKFEIDTWLLQPEGWKGPQKMKTFGQVIVEARKATRLTQKAVAEGLRPGDGRKVLPPYLNDLEHDRPYLREDAVIEQLAKILDLSSVVLYSMSSALRRM